MESIVYWASYLGNLLAYALTWTLITTSVYCGGKFVLSDVRRRFASAPENNFHLRPAPSVVGEVDRVTETKVYVKPPTVATTAIVVTTVCYLMLIVLLGWFALNMLDAFDLPTFIVSAPISLALGWGVYDIRTMATHTHRSVDDDQPTQRKINTKLQDAIEKIEQHQSDVKYQLVSLGQALNFSNEEIKRLKADAMRKVKVTDEPIRSERVSAVFNTYKKLAKP